MMREFFMSLRQRLAIIGSQFKKNADQPVELSSSRQLSSEQQKPLPQKSLPQTTVTYAVWILGALAAVLLVVSLADGGDGREKFLQLLVGGIALGSIYALLSFGFVIVYKATGVFNLAQGGFVLLGTYLAYQFYVDWGWIFGLALAATVIVMATVGAGIERAVMRKMLTKPTFTAIMVTLAILIVLEQITRSIWNSPGLVLAAPWGTGRIQPGGVTIRYLDFWTVGFTFVLLGAFFLFFRYSRLGLGMRATAFDREVASAQGVRVGLSFALSWAIAAAVATVAGVLLTSRSGGALTPAVGYVALRAFPAMILGGLDSTGGAVAGGVIIGVAEVMVQGYVDVDWLGESFETVVPYLVMLPILLWRPHGLFGTKAVERV